MPGTITAEMTRIQTPLNRPSLAVINLTCTADSAAHTYPATVINDLVDYDIRGLRIYSIETIPGATGPTDNTDLTITDENDLDILAGVGANLIDNATKNLYVIGTTSSAIIIGDITINIDNNLVDSAVTNVILTLIGL
jgi:hypothetical protein